jgi:hypothetical protein
VRNPRTKDDKEFQIRAEYYSKLKHECKSCKHKVIIPAWKDSSLCDYCGTLVFKDKKTEDLYRIREKINKC